MDPKVTKQLIATSKSLRNKFKSIKRGMMVEKQNIYEYWDNPNELVERHRLLYASANAGHTGHENEMLSIIEELREAGIIY